MPSVWDFNWSNYFVVKITASDALIQGYAITARYTGSRAAEVYNNSLASGNDLRIVWWDGAAWHELDRDLITFSSSEIVIRFLLQEAISGGASNENHWLYYNNPAAGAPPADWDNIYDFWDDFSTGLGKWPYGAGERAIVDEILEIGTSGVENYLRDYDAWNHPWAAPGYSLEMKIQIPYFPGAGAAYNIEMWTGFKGWWSGAVRVISWETLDQLRFNTYTEFGQVHIHDFDYDTDWHILTFSWPSTHGRLQIDHDTEYISDMLAPFDDQGIDFYVKRESGAAGPSDALRIDWVKLWDKTVDNPPAVGQSLEAPKNLFPACIDTAAGYAYFASYLDPGKIIKIDLSSFTQDETLTLDEGIAFPRCCVLDPSNNIYEGLYLSPGKIAKIRLSDFSHVATKTLVGGEDYYQGAAIDLSAGYAYFSCAITPGKVVRVKLSDFTDTTLDLGDGDKPWAAVLDSSEGYLFLGTQNLPGRLITIRLSDFTILSREQISESEFLSCGAIDTGDQYLYFGSLMSPGKILRIKY